MKYTRVVLILVLLVVSASCPVFGDLQICFVSDREDGMYSLFAMNRDGTAPFNLTKELGFRRIPQLSPNGTKVVFESRGNIFLMNADGSNRVNLTNRPGSDRGPRWSPDGTQILWERWPPKGEGGASIFVMNAGDSDQRDLGRGIWPKWSPDGTMIGFTLYGVPNTAFIMNADGSGRREVTNAVINTRFLSWSPDGERVAFAEHLEVGRRRLLGAGWDNRRHFVYVVDIDGSNLVELTKDLIGRNAYGAEWSPDGEKIVFYTDSGGQDIYVVHVDGTNLVNLTKQHGTGRYDNPLWSEDGTELIFGTDRDGNREIYVMDADGSNPVNLTNHPAEDSLSSWFRLDVSTLLTSVSPQGKLITIWGQIKAVPSNR